MTNDISNLTYGSDPRFTHRGYHDYADISVMEPTRFFTSDILAYDYMEHLKVLKHYHVQRVSLERLEEFFKHVEDKTKKDPRDGRPAEHWGYVAELRAYHNDQVVDV